jgi:hypothetical protein
MSSLGNGWIPAAVHRDFGMLLQFSRPQTTIQTVGLLSAQTAYHSICTIAAQMKAEFEKLAKSHVR